MNAALHYQKLIARAIGREIAGYSELHHVVPRCLGGSDGASNLVRLTAREHHVAHQLLVKIHPGERSLVFAAHMMTVDQGGRRHGNRKYEWLRRRHAAATAELSRGNKYCLGRKYTKELRDKIAKSNADKPKSTEHRAAMSAARTSRQWGPYSCGSPHVAGITQRKNGAFVVRIGVGPERRYAGFYWDLGQAKAALIGG